MGSAAEEVSMGLAVVQGFGWRLGLGGWVKTEVGCWLQNRLSRNVVLGP